MLKSRILLILLTFLPLLYIDAQTIEVLNLPQDATEASALGLEDYQDGAGAITPAGYVLIDNDYITATIDSCAYVKFSCSYAGRDSFATCLVMGSTVEETGSTAIDDLSSIYIDGCAILEIKTKKLGRLTFAYSGGKANSTLYVWDMSANSGNGMCALSNYTEMEDKDDMKIHAPSVSVNASRTYYVFASGNDIELYNIYYDRYSEDTYTELPNEDDYLLNLPTSLSEATALGWTGGWGTVITTPENLVITDNDSIYVEVEEAATLVFECFKAGMGIFPNYIYFGSTVGRNGTGQVVNPSSIYYSGNAIFTAKPYIDGKITLMYNRGDNNSVAYVWDKTINDGTGMCVLSSYTGVYGQTDLKVHTPTFNVTAGHTYYIYSSDNNVEFYNMAFVPYTADNYYGNSDNTTGISEVATTAKSATDGKIYSLDGRYVSGNGLNGIQKGVYIMNGKKYVVK